MGHGHGPLVLRIDSTKAGHGSAYIGDSNMRLVHSSLQQLLLHCYAVSVSHFIIFKLSFKFVNRFLYITYKKQ